MSDTVFLWLFILSVVNVILIAYTIKHVKNLKDVIEDIWTIIDVIGDRDGCWKEYTSCKKYSVTDMFNYLHKELRRVNSSKCDIWERCVNQFSRLERIDEDQSLLLNELGYKIDIEPAKPRKRIIVKQEEEEE